VPYKIIRAKESAPPTDLPVDKKVHAALLRSRKGQNALKLNEFVHIPQYAKLFMNDVELEFLAQDECKVFFKQKGDGLLPPVGVLTISYVAVTPGEIANEFADFWRHPYPLKNEI
jgi:hypothetical protein